MIRIDNRQFYMTLGEGCYIARAADGRLKHVWFGKRVESEDDLSALGGDSFELKSELTVDSGIASETDLAPDTVVDTATGKTLPVDFTVVRSAVTDEKPKAERLPTLRGGKTLIVSLADDRVGLTADIFYTPYSRGGLTRRVEIKNAGKRTLRLRVPNGGVRLVGEYAAFSIGAKVPINFMGLESARGDAYGFCLCYGGAAFMESSTENGATDFESEFADNIILAPGESYTAPELLMVYSDSGRGGAARVFHDIIREFAIPERFVGTRLPIALYCPVADGKAALVAPELGADAFVVPYAPGDGEAFKAVADACKSSSLRLGVKLRSKKDVDLAEQSAVDGLYSELETLIVDRGVEYVSLSEVCAAGRSRAFTLGAYGLLERLSREHPEVTVECAADLGSLCYCPIVEVGEKALACETPIMLCLPPCCIAARVGSGKGKSLKTRFDMASFGCLGYAFDPRELTEDMRRAVRAQVYSYQDDAKLITNGDLYLLGGAGFVAVSKDKSKAYAAVVGGTRSRVMFRGLDEHNLYHVRELDKTFSGAALVYYGITVPDYAGDGETLSFHFRQAADYE